MSGRGVVSGLARGAARKLPPTAQDQVRRLRDELTGLAQLKANHSMLALRVANLERQAAGPPQEEPLPPDGRFPDHVRSRLCTHSQLHSPWFEQWCAAMGIPPTIHRKQWEFAYIAEVLEALGQLGPGKRGLGFGVGREPLVSLLAARGVAVTATDLEPEAREATSWIKSAQHAQGGVEAMLNPEVCDPAEFARLVSWQAVDMRAIPDDLKGYDFCWSACSLEHLGTLDLGLEFIEESLKTLRPGGIAVHTTEFNLSSDDDTIEAGATVVYRKRDMVAFREKLEAQGHEVAALDFNPGTGVLDQYVDLPPYSDEPVLRFFMGGYTLTSIAMVVRKGSQPTG